METQTFPCVGVNSPAMIRSKVLFPAPFIPLIEKVPGPNRCVDLFEYVSCPEVMRNAGLL